MHVCKHCSLFKNIRKVKFLCNDLTSQINKILSPHRMLLQFAALYSILWSFMVMEHIMLQNLSKTLWLLSLKKILKNELRYIQAIYNVCVMKPSYSNPKSCIIISFKCILRINWWLRNDHFTCTWINLTKKCHLDLVQ